MLQFNLVENLMTPAPDDFMAQTVNVRSYTEEEIADQMLKRGTLLTKAEILAVAEVRQAVIRDILADGGAVTTALFNAQPSISGVFNGAGDGFDPARHKTRVNLTPGKLLREAEKQIKATKVHVAEPLPYITEVKDVVSGAVNGQLTAGGVIQLRGSRLSFFADKPGNGLFLIAEDGAETRCDTIIENKPARIIAMLPAGLAAGNYYIEVRTTLMQSGAREGKQLKTGRFARMLSI